MYKSSGHALITVLKNEGITGIYTGYGFACRDTTRIIVEILQGIVLLKQFNILLICELLIVLSPVRELKYNPHYPVKGR